MLASDSETLLRKALPRCGTAAINALAPLFVADSARKGDILVAEGGQWKRAFLVATGSVRLYFTRQDGREFNKNFFAEGVLVLPIPDTQWYQPSAFGIAALERSTFWCADNEAIRAVLRAHDEWDKFQSDMVAAMLRHKLSREHDLLAMDGRQRYEAFCQRHPKLAKRIPLAHLASYLGLTDVSLSRIRRNLSDGAEN